MGLVVYGHPELDAQIAKYNLGHAHIVEPVRACREPVEALAGPWMEYLQASHGGVEVHAGPGVPTVSGVLGDGGALARYAVAAVDALAEVLATDPARVAEYGPQALDGLLLGIAFKERTATLSPDGQVASDVNLALVSITAPPWTHQRYWDGRSHWYWGGFTTVAYHDMRVAVRQAWDALAASA